MRPRDVLLSTLAASAAVVVLLQLSGLDASTVLLVSNVGMVVTALLASVSCALAARRTTGRRRAMWGWLSVATGAWTVGQVIWSWYVAVLGTDIPLPSLADVAFLAFPVAASVAMLIWLGSHGQDLTARGRDLLDGAIIAGSLLVLSWVTVLDAVVQEQGGPRWLLALGLAYPLGDVVLGTLVLLALVRGAPRERFTLGVLAAALGGLALSDSAYLYFQSRGAEWSADLYGLGYFFGFLLVIVAAVTDDAPVAASGADPAPSPVAHTDLSAWSLLRLALPYLPLVAALVALAVSVAGATTAPPTTDLVLGACLVLIVLTRQFLAMVENLRLLVAVQQGRDRLQHLALHDALTGLPNRVLFDDRLDRALLDRSATVGVLFCDLDDFKQVNDAHGHEAGDALLRAVADRLLASVRTTDTVARFGGDEFAVVLADSPDAGAVAERIVTAVRRPVAVGDATVVPSVSVGVAQRHPAPDVAGDRRGPAGVDPTGRGSTSTGSTSTGPDASGPAGGVAGLLLRTADEAMYAAKRAGKGHAVVLDLEVHAAPARPARNG